MGSGSEPAGSSDYLEVLNRLEAAQESDAIEQALVAAHQRLGMDVAYVTTIDARHQTIDAVAGDTARVPVIVKGAVYPVEQTYCLRMLSGDIPNVIADTRADPAVRDMEASEHIGAYVGVPVRLSSGRVHGSLCCVSKEPRAGLGSEDVHFMDILAGMVAARVERAQSDLVRRAERLGEHG